MAKLELRVRELERLLGKLTLENEMLKRACDLNTKGKKDDLSIVTPRDWEQSQSVPAGANGIVLLPYFNEEHSPIYDVNACGVFFGLRLEHTRADMFKAVLEGIGMSIRHNIETLNSLGLTPHEMIAVGGGTKNLVWLQAVSDICMFEQRISEMSVGAAYGNAFLAGVGVGMFNAVEDVKKWVRYKEYIKPNKTNKITYDNCFNKYLRLYENNKELMKLT